MPDETNVSASRNTILTIILVLLILITGAMIFNFYGMKFQDESNRIPKCVGSDDLMLNAIASDSHMDQSVDNNVNDINNDVKISESRAERLGKLLKEKVGDYRDGSYHPEIQREMIKRAQEDVRKRIREKIEEKANEIEDRKIEYNKAETETNVETMTSNKKSLSGAKSDKPENEKTKLCIYHMYGCGHCHDIMSDKQQNGMTKFEELQKLFQTKPEVEILDFQHGRDSEASKFSAFPVIMLIKSDGSSLEYDRERSVEGMARFIIQNM